MTIARNGAGSTTGKRTAAVCTDTHCVYNADYVAFAPIACVTRLSSNEPGKGAMGTSQSPGGVAGGSGALPGPEERFHRSLGFRANVLENLARILAEEEGYASPRVWHVERAQRILAMLPPRSNLRSECLKVVGGALFGTLVPGLMSSLPAHDTTASVLYIAFGLIGISMVFVGLASPYIS